MGREFQWLTREGDWKNHADLGDTLRTARKRVPDSEAPYRLTKNGKKLRRGARRWVLNGLEDGLKKGSNWRHLPSLGWSRGCLCLA